ncbi:MAG: DUF1553 domain-containing protein [Verrucomicrobia bacterium]|nr:DUF1553 domain-containing protein [Verrucomicrobiota bacterium]
MRFTNSFRFLAAPVLTALAFAVPAAEPPVAKPPPKDGFATSGPVKVELFEGQPVGKELDLDDAKPVESYTEMAFGFVRVPAKYSVNALPLDRSNPFVLRTTYEGAYPAGEYQLRLRTKGSSRFFLDGQQLLVAKPQKGNTSGHDAVPPAPERGNSPLRPVEYPHQEIVATVKLDGHKHTFTLVALVGGKGLVPSPGELSVSIGKSGEVPRLVGGDKTPPLTDADWEKFAAASRERHAAADRIRRREVSAGVAAAWDAYHKRVAEAVKRTPAPAPPQVSAGTPVLNAIDRFIGVKLEAAKVQPTSLISDLEFLRRVSLDTIGLIPTPDEIRAFLADAPGQRRAHAIERLLAHPGWAAHWVGYWQDVLAENPGFLKPDLNNSGPFRWWVHQSFEDGIPFDRFVAELIQMEGSALAGAPAGFRMATLNDAPMAMKADIISQAFLAEKLSCARCHDAPDHPHKQADTFGIASMLEGRPVKLPKTSTVPVVEGFRKPRVEISLKPGEEIPPHWPFERFMHGSELTKQIPLGKTAPETRSQAAAFVVSPENERFAKVIVNRVWKRYFGAALVEPVDDWHQRQNAYPELMDWLAREFITSGYDIKALARLLFNSHLYQRAPVDDELNNAANSSRLFAGPMRRHLTAEQLVDSLFRVSGKDFGCEELNLNPIGDRPLSEFLNLGTPKRAWEFSAMMNERARPALALPVAQSIVDVLTTYGWRQSRQNPASVRDDAPSPMQTVLLANGVLGTRVTRLSDDSAFTQLALADRPMKDLLNETFLRVLGRLATESEFRTATEFLQPVFNDRRKEGAVAPTSLVSRDTRVSWGNHLSSEATLIRMEEERRLRMGDAPTGRLKPDFRERYEDLIWSLVNAPELTLVP